MRTAFSAVKSGIVMFVVPFVRKKENLSELVSNMSVVPFVRKKEK